MMGKHVCVRVHVYKQLKQEHINVFLCLQIFKYFHIHIVYAWQYIPSTQIITMASDVIK